MNENTNLTKEEAFDEMLKQALEEVAKKEAEEFENIDTSEEITYSRRHKIRMNRLFRERVGGTFLPFPEADNAFERLRSKIVIKFKINERCDKKKHRGS